MIEQDVISLSQPAFPRTEAIPKSSGSSWSASLDFSEPTAIIVVDEIHALGSFCMRQIKDHFPDFFRSVIFVGGQPLLTKAFVDEDCRPLPRLLNQYVRECQTRLSLPAAVIVRTDHDPVKATFEACQQVLQYCPKALIIQAVLSFKNPRWYHQLLHKQPEQALRERLTGSGHPVITFSLFVDDEQPEVAG